jgi:hypothetical protein
MASLTTAAAGAAIGAARNAAADAVLALCDAGVLRIYSGTVPVEADAGLSGNVVLAELTLAADAFGAAVNGVAAANAITTDAAANATGTPTFFRVFRADGSTLVWQGTAGASGAELNLADLTAGQIIAGSQVSISSLTYTQTATF